MRAALVLVALGGACSMRTTGQPRPSEHYPAFFDALPSMVGKRVAVTGASKGLGLVTALSMAKKGARVFLLNRPSSASRDALAAVAGAATGAAPVLVDVDLRDFASVRAAAAALAVHAPALDVLCCNAGIMLQPDEPSVDGYDITAATNVLSHFLLVRELMPSLERAAAECGQARVVSMSSGSGFGPPALDARYLAAAGGSLGGAAQSYERYHQSKLANLCFTASLHERLAAKGSRVRALVCTPGVCSTDMYVAVASRSGAPADLSRVPSVEDGCLAQLKCIADPSAQSGQLWGPPMAGGPPVEVRLAPPTVLVDERSKADLWAACERAVGAFDV